MAVAWPGGSARPDLADSLRPPSADGTGTGALMSLLAHAALLAALTLGVQWRTEAPAGVEAELWAAVPEIAAPPPAAEPKPEPVPPPPQPAAAKPLPPPAEPDRSAERDAQIATEKADRLEKERRAAEDQRARARREQAERDKAAQKQRDKQEAEQREKQQAAEQKKLEQQQRDKAERADAARREKLRQDQLQRMNDQLGGNGAPTSTGSAARSAGPSASYAGRIKARIKPNIVFPDSLDGNPSAEVEVRVGADGSIIGRRLLKSSGSREWDDAVLRAIDKTAVLPRDTDGRVEPLMLIEFKPRE